jgi:hypothetical protein
VSADASAPPPAPPEPKRAPPPGSSGPTDAVGLVGEAGRIVPEGAETILFVNGAAIRKLPSADAFRRAITSTLVGWDQFMPVDLVDPIRDIDWVVIAGSLMLGSTQKNVFLAHYNVPEPAADVVTNKLVARMPKGKREGNGLTAEIDGAPRAYLRPKAGVLAIVPPEDGKRVADVLGRAKVAASVRPGEALRVVWNGRRRAWATHVPRAVTRARAWILAGDDGHLRVAAEGDCADEGAASEAVGELHDELDRVTQSTFARLLLGPLAEAKALWSDAHVVRYDAPLDDRIVEFIGGAAGPP